MWGFYSLNNFHFLKEFMEIFQSAKQKLKVRQIKLTVCNASKSAVYENHRSQLPLQALILFFYIEHYSGNLPY